MNIELITTKKKLTKKILNQMQKGENYEILNNCTKVFGYILGTINGSYKAILIESNNDYYILSSNWIKGNKKIYRKIDGTRYSTQLLFKKEEELDIFWDKLQNILNKATTHIYI